MAKTPETKGRNTIFSWTGQFFQDACKQCEQLKKIMNC
jgi:hypothetical protein